MLKLIVLLSFSLFFQPAMFAEPQGQTHEQNYWLEQTERACRAIDDDHMKSLAIKRFVEVCVVKGRLELGASVVSLIEDPSLRAETGIVLAKGYEAAAKPRRILEQLKNAEPSAIESGRQKDLLNAYLELLDAPDLAIAFVLSNDNSSRGITQLCESLAKSGYLDRSISTAEQNMAPKALGTLKFRIALASAEAGRVEDTQRAAALVEMDHAIDVYQQKIWLALAKGLYRNGDYLRAQEFAEQVTNRSLQTHNQNTLKKLMRGRPADLDSMVKKDERELGSFQFVDEVASSGKVTSAEELFGILDSAVRQAERKPVKEKQGQFGPSNQKTRLASLRLNYAAIAKRFYDQGMEVRARETMELVEDALVQLTEANSFFASLKMHDFLRMQVAIRNVDGIVQTIQRVPAGLWYRSADSMVEFLLRQGENVSASTVAQTLLEGKALLGTSAEGKPKTMLSNIMAAAGAEVVFEVLDTTDVSPLGTEAIEDLGSKMFRIGEIEGLRERLNSLPATQRAYLCIGVVNELDTRAEP